MFEWSEVTCGPMNEHQQLRYLVFKRYWIKETSFNIIQEVGATLKVYVCQINQQLRLPLFPNKLII